MTQSTQGIRKTAGGGKTQRMRVDVGGFPLDSGTLGDECLNYGQHRSRRGQRRQSP
jgi:hypothetical protein